MSTELTMGSTVESTALGISLNQLVNTSSPNTAENCVHNISGEEMAGRLDGANSLTSTVLCRYFAAGICRFGSLCRFSHDTVVENPPSNPSLENQEDTFDTASALNDDSVNKTLPENNTNIYDPTDPTSWINAPVFVPKYSINSNQCVDVTETASPANISNDESNNSKSYAQILSDGGGGGGVAKAAGEQNVQSTEVLCPYVHGTPILGLNNELTMLCRYGNECVYKHGCLCDMCGQFCLHPTNMEQRRQHELVGDGIYIRCSYFLILFHYFF